MLGGCVSWAAGSLPRETVSHPGTGACGSQKCQERLGLFQVVQGLVVSQDGGEQWQRLPE